MRPERTRFIPAILILTATLSQAATYYIDYQGGDDANPGIAKAAPWKRCPAMPGFKGAYAHQAGDVFIFKGGSIWSSDALPFEITGGGAAGKPDAYTTDHSWYSGPLWTQPTMDGQLDGRTLLSCTNASFFVINDLHFKDAGSLSANGILGTAFSDCGDFELSRNTFALETWGGLYIGTSKPKFFDNILIHHNDISHSAFGIRIVPSGPGSIMRNVLIYNNSLHDFHSQLSGEVHGDGIQHYCSPDEAASSDRYIDGFKIYNNAFTGDFTQVPGSSGAMTALVYLSGASKGVEIYNNLFAPQTSGQQSPNFFESFISLRDNPSRGGFHKIYNNTFVTRVANGQSAALLEDDLRYPSPNLDVKNNIFYGFQWPFDLRSVTHSFDNNDLSFTRNVGKWAGQWVETFADWQSLGNDLHGISEDPQFVSATNYHLLKNSPCVNRGAILSASYASDEEGVLRPQGSSFDLGAYETVESTVGVSEPAVPEPNPGEAAAPAAPVEAVDPAAPGTRTFGIDGRRIRRSRRGTASQGADAAPAPVVVDPDAASGQGAQVHFK